jgi:single-strand DNA-binding protein
VAVVSGRLQIRSWQDKDGNKRKTAEVVADNVYFGDSKTTGNNFDSIPATGNDFPVLDFGDEQLPF